jgi:hypothetical protein
MKEDYELGLSIDMIQKTESKIFSSIISDFL